jgi:hypothetical protein
VNVDRVYHLTADGDHLVLRALFQPPVALLPLSDTTYPCAATMTRYTPPGPRTAASRSRSPRTDREWPAVGKRVAIPSFWLDVVAAGRIDQAVEWYRAESLKAPLIERWAKTPSTCWASTCFSVGRRPGALALLRVNVARFPRHDEHPYDTLAYVWSALATGPAIATYEKKIPGDLLLATRPPRELQAGFTEERADRASALGAWRP